MHLDPQNIPVAYALAAVFAWGWSDFIGGYATRRVNAFLFTAAVHTSGMFLMGSLALYTHAPFPDKAGAAWSLVAGVLGGGALAIFYRALSMGNMGLTTPVAAVVGAALPTLFSLRTEGFPGYLPLAGFLLAGIGVWLISRPDQQGGPPAGLWQAALAGIGFAGFYICVREAGDASSYWVAALSRVSALIVTAAVVLVAGHTRSMDRSSSALAVVAGILDVSGTLVFVRASQGGRLDSAVVLSSLYPAITVLLARIFLKEHFTHWKVAGIVAALLSVVLIALH